MLNLLFIILLCRICFIRIDNRNWWITNNFFIDIICSLIKESFKALFKVLLKKKFYFLDLIDAIIYVVVILIY